LACCFGTLGEGVGGGATAPTETSICPISSLKIADPLLSIGNLVVEGFKAAPGCIGSGLLIACQLPLPIGQISRILRAEVAGLRSSCQRCCGYILLGVREGLIQRSLILVGRFYRIARLTPFDGQSAIGIGRLFRAYAAAPMAHHVGDGAVFQILEARGCLRLAQRDFSRCRLIGGVRLIKASLRKILRVLRHPFAGSWLRILFSLEMALAVTSL
jgi:hypothetical protein